MSLFNYQGRLAGPDGLALDEKGNIAVAYGGLGTVSLFDLVGEPLARVRSCAGLMTANIVYGGCARKKLYIMESERGGILVAGQSITPEVWPLSET